jgi:hypothetical protein
VSTPTPALGGRTGDPAPALGVVLIGFADALAAPESAWSLLDAGADVVAFARRGTRPALRHAHGVRIVEISAPELDATAAIGDLSELIGSGAHDVVMPLDDASLWLCGRAIRPGAGVRLAGAEGPCAELALDKRRQLAAARAAGFAVPPTWELGRLADLERLTDLPVVVKPALPVAESHGRLARGANRTCGSRAELDLVAGRISAGEPLLAQPLLHGTGEGLFGLASGGRLLALSAHRRIRTMNPAGSGSSACASVAVDPALAEAAERMLRAAGWRGMFMLEFLRDDDGTPWFMELNGRPWGSMALARRAGFEYPAWSVRQMLEPGFEPAAPAESPALVCRHLGRELVHLAMVMRGPRSAAQTGWPSRAGTVRELLRRHPGQCWYNARAGERRLFLEDTLQTVRSVAQRGSLR